MSPSDSNSFANKDEGSVKSSTTGCNILLSSCKLSSVAMTYLKTLQIRYYSVCGVDGIDIRMSRVVSRWPWLLILLFEPCPWFVQLEFSLLFTAKNGLMLGNSADDFVSHQNVEKDLSMVRVQSHNDTKFSVLHCWRAHHVPRVGFITGITFLNLSTTLNFSVFAIKPK